MLVEAAMISLRMAKQEHMVALHSVVQVCYLPFSTRPSLLISLADAKLAFVMTSYYEATNRNSQSCNFGGNATVNTAAPSSASALNSAVSQCLSNTQTTFTPSLPSTTAGSSSATHAGSSNSPQTSSGAIRAVNGLESVAGLLVALAFSVASGFYVLAL